MLKELIRLYISPLLKRQGFRKKGNIWNRDVGGIIHVIDIQSTMRRADGSESFTINIGVFINELWQLFWAKGAPKFIKEENCYPRFRLGFLLSEFDTKSRDKWWNINSQDQIESIGKELEVAFIEECLPFLNRIVSECDALEVSINTNFSMPVEKLSHAILLNLLGKRVESDQFIDSLISDSHWGVRATEIKERLAKRD